MLEKKWYRAFRRIIKGIENEGYCQWKEAVQHSITNKDKNTLINTYKRCEIKAEFLKRDNLDGDVSGMIKIVGSQYGSVITLCIALGGWMVSMISGFSRLEDMEKVLSINLDFMLFIIQEIMQVILAVILFWLCLYMGVRIFVYFIQKRDIYHELYYKEMMLILKEELDRRESIEEENNRSKKNYKHRCTRGTNKTKKKC